MYQQHWGFTDLPYRDGVDVESYQSTPVHDEALARMHFLLENRRQLGLLVGPTGTGKSLLLRVFAQELRGRGVPTANIDLLGIDTREFLWQLGTSWKIASRTSDSVFHAWRRLVDCIQEFRAIGARGIVLLDNADEATSDVLLQTLRLSLCDPTAQSPLTMILTARPERLVRLGDRLLELASLRIDVTPWEAEETSEFVRESLKNAGRKEPAFQDEALAQIHRLTDGNPRRVRQLADLALIAGAGDQLEQVDGPTVQAVYAELGVR